MEVIDESTLPLAHIPGPYLLGATEQYYVMRQTSGETCRKEDASYCSTNLTRKKMRILIATGWDHPAVGWLQRYIEMLKVGLESRGHHVDAFAPNPCPKSTVLNLKKKIAEDMKI